MSVTTEETATRYQAIVDELRQVCEKHGVQLVGTCLPESIGGEIEIVEAQKKEYSKVSFNEVRRTNFVQPVGGVYWVEAIG